MRRVRLTPEVKSFLSTMQRNRKVSEQAPGYRKKLAKQPGSPHR